MRGLSLGKGLRSGESGELEKGSAFLPGVSPGKNLRLTKPLSLFIMFLKAMMERDGDADLQRAGGRCEPAGMVPRSYGS